METRLKIGVVGAGVFGGYHSAKCVAHPRVDWAGTFDENLSKAQALADNLRGKAFESLDALLAESDALIIACSASAHAEAALAAIKAGKHVLVEKPIADTLGKATAIVEAADQAGVVLQVGHQERFVAKSIGLKSIPEAPLAIRAWRHTPYSERGTDVSVVLDLMTHDVDLVLWLMGSDPLDVRGEAEVVRSNHADKAEAVLDFEGTTAWLSASRVAETPKRIMELSYPSGTVEIDFNAKTLTHDTPFDLNANFAESAEARDSLGAATHAFVEAVLDGKPVPITGGNGLRALHYALAATASVKGD